MMCGELSPPTKVHPHNLTDNSSDFQQILIAIKGGVA